MKNDLQQMNSEIVNMSEKLDTLMTQKETKDEGQFQIKTDSILCTIEKYNTLREVPKKWSYAVVCLYSAMSEPFFKLSFIEDAVYKVFQLHD